MPYYSGWPALDLWGLNDPFIALHGKHEPAYSNYVLGRRPDLIVMGSKSPKRFDANFSWERSLYPRCLQQGLRPVKIITYDPGNYYLWLIAKPDSPVARYLEQWHPANAVPVPPAAG
jgi:hypothetical protein